MGWRKFKARYCPLESDEFAQRAIEVYRKEECPEVPKVWRALEECAVKTVWDRRSYETYGIVYALEDGWLTCRLPSGRKLWYYDPRPVRKAMPWDKDDVRPGFEYSAQKAGQWKRISAYGGLLTENVVQATARDMLVNALFNAESDGHPVVLTVHDEAVLEVPAALANVANIKQYMEHQPQWVRDLRVPVAGDYWTGARYRK
jgi:DNA polymerase